MNNLRTYWLVPALFSLASACLDTATTDPEILPPVEDDQSPGTADGNGGGDGDGTPVGGDGDGTPGGDGDGTPGGDGDGTPGGDGDGSSSGDGDTDPPPPAESQIDGTAEASSCSSFTPRSGDACYGFYCGTTAAQLAIELPGGRKCSYSAEDACSGKVSQKVGSCARSVKSANLFDTDEQIRMKTAACVYEDQSLKDTVPEDCLACYITAAQCASDNCLTQCLTGDNANCDACRLENNCNQPVYACGGLPSPF